MPQNLFRETTVVKPVKRFPDGIQITGIMKLERETFLSGISHLSQILQCR